MLQRCEIVSSTEKRMTCRVFQEFVQLGNKSDRHHEELGQPKGEHAVSDFCRSRLRERIKGKGDGWRQFLCSRCSRLFLTSPFLSPSVLPVLLLRRSPRRRETRSCFMFQRRQQLPLGLDRPSALHPPQPHWELVGSERGGLSLTLTRTTHQRLNRRL